MFSRVDLHTHSDCSDGALTPVALVERAAARQLELLALTDHDTVAGCVAARAACETHSIRFIPGVELSCEWRGREIHIIALNVDTQEPGLQRHCADVLERRRQRMVEIASRLSAAGLPGDELVRPALAATAPTRTHMARALCASGVAPTVQRAFDTWLKRGRPGYVAAQWPDLGTAVQCATAAGAVAVLAHPHRYQVSNGALRELLAEFKSAGGKGIEVSLSGMSPRDADRAAALARRFDLAGSIGSDFHEPDLPWRPLGRFAKLPDGVTPIMSHLGLVTGRSWG
jgi:predicted metal-dependent phosphoesterase TrpH